MTRVDRLLRGGSVHFLSVARIMDHAWGPKTETEDFLCVTMTTFLISKATLMVSLEATDSLEDYH